LAELKRQVGRVRGASLIIAAIVLAALSALWAAWLARATKAQQAWTDFFPQIFGKEPPVDPVPLAVGGGLLILCALLSVYVPVLYGKMRGASAGIGVRIVASLFSVIIFFALMEHVLYERERHAAAKWHSSYIMPHPLRLWRLTPRAAEGTERFRLNINSHGVRGDEFQLAKQPGEIRILFLGDSWTMGFGVDEEKTFCRLLEKRLDREFPEKPVRVINGGTIGYSARQCLLYAIEAVPLFKPDLIVVDYMRNYHSERVMEELSPQAGNPLMERAREILYRSRLFLYMRRLLLWGRLQHLIRERGLEFTDDYYRSNLRAIIDLARKSGVPIAFVDFYVSGPNESFCAAAKESGVPLIEVRLHRSHFLSWDPDHPGEQGQVVICDALHRFLTRGDLLPALRRK
jgi:hypothetical protein